MTATTRGTTSNISRNTRRNRRRKRRQRFFRSLIKTAMLLGIVLFGVTLISHYRDGESNGDGLSKTISSVFSGGEKEKKDDMAYTAPTSEELKALPESLQTLYEKNEEARAFVAHYKEKHNNQDDIDISKEVKKGKIPLFIQWDERWGYRDYGGDFLAVTGCGPTALSMVYTGLTGDKKMNPYAMSRLAYQNGYYVEGTGSSWSMMSELATWLGLNAKELSKDENIVRNELNAGHPIICIMGPGDFTDAGHFIVLTGIDSEGKIKVNDPNSRYNSEKTWDVEVLLGQLKNLWSYEL